MSKPSNKKKQGKAASDVVHSDAMSDDTQTTNQNPDPASEQAEAETASDPIEGTVPAPEPEPQPVDDDGNLIPTPEPTSTPTDEASVPGGIDANSPDVEPDGTQDSAGPVDELPGADEALANAATDGPTTYVPPADGEPATIVNAEGEVVATVPVGEGRVLAAGERLEGEVDHTDPTPDAFGD